ncbi:MAG: hypothetical protein J7K87_02550 [Candidatus Aenigmarchaeota archaeon]|nr:hypothetical protein [Candidatus Aenigmarchaeota archaeon]
MRKRKDKTIFEIINEHIAREVIKQGLVAEYVEFWSKDKVGWKKLGKPHLKKAFKEAKNED